MQAKVFKKERERLRPDQKSLVTSKGVLNKIGAMTKADADEDATDMNLLKNEEDYTRNQVLHLQNIANML